MGVISMFYGIIISMYFFDNRQHKRPHIHGNTRAYEAVFSIPDGELLDGEMSAGKTRLVKAWIEIHRDELMADWELATQGQPIFKIEPLR